MTDFHTNRKDQSLELSASDAMQWSPKFSTWLGLRHTQLRRSSERTDPSNPRATSYKASVTTPWLAAGYQ